MNAPTTIEQSKPAVASDGFGAWWEIPHPGTLEKLRCATFNEAMDKWFEGFNIPLLVVDGVREDFSKACDRVRRYYAAPNEKLRHSRRRQRLSAKETTNEPRNIERRSGAAVAL